MTIISNPIRTLIPWRSMRNLLVVLAIVASSAAFANPPALVSAARQQTGSRVVYDGSYTRIGYPMGDVPQSRGVCTDVVIRTYRAIGIVSDRVAADSGRPLILHNIGAGPAEEDMLFSYPITGHYRYRVR